MLGPRPPFGVSPLVPAHDWGAYWSGRIGFPEGSLPDVPPIPCAHPILWDELPEWGLLLDRLGLVLDGLHMGP